MTCQYGLNAGNVSATDGFKAAPAGFFIRSSVQPAKAEDTGRFLVPNSSRPMNYFAVEDADIRAASCYDAAIPSCQSTTEEVPCIAIRSRMRPE